MMKLINIIDKSKILRYTKFQLYKHRIAGYFSPNDIECIMIIKPQLPKYHDIKAKSELK